MGLNFGVRCSFQMAAASPNNSVRIVVIGDKGTGKSSLIVAAATDSFPPNAPPVLPDTKLPFQFFPDGIPVTLVDTSSRCSSLFIFASGDRIKNVALGDGRGK